MMAEIHDLRSYLAVLESAGQLARIVRPVSLDHELADVAAALERASGPAPLFETRLRPTGAADRSPRGRSSRPRWRTRRAPRWRWAARRGRWSR